MQLEAERDRLERLTRKGIGMPAAGILYAGWTVVWVLLQVRQWWLPYLFGPTPPHRDFGWYWEGGYAQTLHILPARGVRPVPDAEQFVLQLLSLAAAFFTVRAAIDAWMDGTAARRRGGSLDH
ncbi:MAG: hypothetical protein EHM55_08050 [Acidobacteria bacterium]|nr:MAG: hypothetical protein EHM55_08050 [Acidobacteriota bacterium]